jgi:hypothetical protein
MDRVALQSMRAEDIIALFKQAIIRRQFPAQFLSRTFEEIQAALRARMPGTQKAWKLLVDGRFDK